MAYAIFSVYLSHQRSKLEFVVPIKFALFQGATVSSAEVRTVKVRLSGSPQEIHQVTAADLSAYVDVNNKRARGEGTFPIFLTRSEKLRTLNTLSFRIVPEKLKLSYDMVVAKEVPVRVPINGENAVEPNVSIYPAKLLVFGPRERVQKITEVVTSPVDYSEGDLLFSLSVQLQPIDYVSYSEDSVQISIGAFQEGDVWITQAVVPQIINLNPDFELAQEVGAVAVNFLRKNRDTSPINVKDLRLVADCAEINRTGVHTVRLKLDPIPGLKVDFHPSTILLELKKVK